MAARTRMICNLGTRDFFRLTDDESDTMLYEQIWYRTEHFVKKDGKKKYECYQQNGKKYGDTMPGTRRVFPLDKAEAEKIWAAMREAANTKKEGTTT